MAGAVSTVAPALASIPARADTQHVHCQCEEHPWRAGNSGKNPGPPASTRMITRMSDPQHPIFLSYRRARRPRTGNHTDSEYGGTSHQCHSAAGWRVTGLVVERPPQGTARPPASSFVARRMLLKSWLTTFCAPRTHAETRAGATQQPGNRATGQFNAQPGTDVDSHLIGCSEPVRRHVQPLQTAGNCDCCHRGSTRESSLRELMSNFENTLRRCHSTVW